VAETSRGQRLIASELGVHVLGIAQIGREAERGDAKAMPKLSHLRESGSLEQDADVVMLLHRARDSKTGLFDRNKPPALSLAKGRMDETAIMLLGYEPARATFFDWNGDEKFGDIYR
jgi:replicative DNA helicase